MIRRRQYSKTKPYELLLRNKDTSDTPPFARDELKRKVCLSACVPQWSDMYPSRLMVYVLSSLYSWLIYASTDLQATSASSELCRSSRNFIRGIGLRIIFLLTFQNKVKYLKQ